MAGEKILLIEDAKNLREIISFTLKQKGFQVIESAEGDDGYKKAITENPNLIILDAMLPNKTGFDICIDLKGDPKYNDIPIIILTAITKGTGKDDNYWREKSHADEFMSKPFRAVDLLTKIEKLLKKSGK